MGRRKSSGATDASAGEVENPNVRRSSRIKDGNVPNPSVTPKKTDIKEAEPPTKKHKKAKDLAKEKPVEEEKKEEKEEAPAENGEASAEEEEEEEEEEEPAAEADEANGKECEAEQEKEKE